MARTFIKISRVRLIVACAIFIPIFWNAAVSYGHDCNQDPTTATIASTKSVESVKANRPKFSEYRGVTIGMSADDARQKLGKPTGKSETQDFFVFSNNESAQIFYDDRQKVFAISIDFNGKGNAAPGPIDILGRDIKAKPDGSMYLMQQYADVGYWVSYNRTAGDSPLITVTMQRIAK